MNKIEKFIFDSNISMLDICIYFFTNWKKFFAVFISGLMIGACAWYLHGGYVAKTTLYSNESAKLDIAEWKVIQNKLPNLASEIVNSNRLSPKNLSLYEAMSDNLWWLDHFQPVYTLTKSDLREFPGDINRTGGGHSQILGFKLWVGGRSKTDSLENLNSAQNFIRTGSAFLKFREIFNSYSADIPAIDAKVQKEASEINLRINYLKSNLVYLGGLRSKYSNNIKNDESLKYINSKMLDMELEINSSNSNLENLNNQKESLVFLKDYLAAASVIIEGNYNGLDIADKMLVALSTMRNERQYNSKQLVALDKAINQLVELKLSYSSELKSDAPPTLHQSGLFKYLLISSLGMLLIMVLVLGGHQLYFRIVSTK